MSKVSYYTAEGLKKLKDELEHLKSVMRPKASQDIGDVTEIFPVFKSASLSATSVYFISIPLLWFLIFTLESTNAFETYNCDSSINLA